MRVKGHKLVELTNEGGGGVVDGLRQRGGQREHSLAERSWTFRCSCGAQESCRRKQDVIFEYRQHLISVLARQKAISHDCLSHPRRPQEGRARHHHGPDNRILLHVHNDETKLIDTFELKFDVQGSTYTILLSQFKDGRMTGLTSVRELVENIGENGDFRKEST